MSIAPSALIRTSSWVLVWPLQGNCSNGGLLVSTFSQLSSGHLILPQLCSVRSYCCIVSLTDFLGQRGKV